MIKIEHVVLASPEQMEFIIEGMRNPMNSHDRSDSDYSYDYIDDFGGCHDEDFNIGPNDLDLMQRLANAGTDHRKFMRMMPVYVRITAPLYWWKEFDTYKVGSVANSCSTMHKIHEKEFTLEDFSTEHLKTGAIICLNDTIDELNKNRDRFINFDNLGYDNDIYGPERKAEIKKDLWWQMIQLLPSSYNQTRNVMLNYEVLCNIYRSRRGHRLDEWRELCSWVESLPYSELITGNISRGMRQTVGILDEAIENYGKTDEANDIIDKINAIGNPNPVSVEDIKECMKNFDPNDGVRNHVTMIGDD